MGPPVERSGRGQVAAVRLERSLDRRPDRHRRELVTALGVRPCGNDVAIEAGSCFGDRDVVTPESVDDGVELSRRHSSMDDTKDQQAPSSRCERGPAPSWPVTRRPTW